MQTNIQPYSSTRGVMPTSPKMAIMDLVEESSCLPMPIIVCPVKKRKKANPPVFLIRRKL